MALKIYTDAGTTTQALPNDVFDDEVTGSEGTFTLVFLTGVQVGAVYVETRQAFAAITFNNGVSSQLPGTPNFAVDSLIGKRVIHNGEFRGVVASNTADTITLDTTYTQATASSCSICTFTKKTLTTDYSIVGNTIVFGVAPASGTRVHVVPEDDAGLAFGGEAGDSVTIAGAVWLKREPGFEYRSIKVYSQDNSIDDVVTTQAGVTAASGVLSGFSGLATNALAGYAVWHNGAFRGIVESNDATTVTLVPKTYTNAVASDAQCFNIGPMEFSLDSTDGTDGTWAEVVAVPDITTDTAVKIWYRDTVTIPTSPMNYPNVVIKATGVEYLA